MLMACASSQVRPEAAPEPEKTGPSIQVEHYTLDNGLTVLMSHDARLPVVAVEIRYLVGSANEVAGRSGFAHLFEHLMFQGSENFNDEYFKPLDPIGARVNGTTSEDRTNYYERVPREYLELALWLESDRMENLLPALTQEKLDNQRDVVKNERRQSYEDRPYGTAWLKLQSNLFAKGHPYDHSPIGSHADLTAATLDDVKGFFRQYYAPANAILTIVGDYNADEAKGLVKKYFGPIKAGVRADKPATIPTELATSIHVVEPDEVELPRVFFAWHTPPFLKEGDAELDILSSILTEGKTSRLYKPLVYEQKVAKDVMSFQVSKALGGYFVLMATAAPGKSMDELVSAVNDALKTALATPPTPDEMTRVVNGWKKSFYGRMESVLARAQLLSTYYHLTGNPSMLNADLQRYLTLDAATVHAAAQKFLSGKRVRVDVVPKPVEPETPEKAATAGGHK